MVVVSYAGANETVWEQVVTRLASVENVTATGCEIATTISANAGITPGAQRINWIAIGPA